MEGLYHDTTPDETIKPKSTAPSPDAQDVEVPETTDDSPSSSEADFSASEFNAALSVEDKVNLLSQMIRIRRFEERSLRAYQQGHIGGFLHLYIGQEAVAVGSVSSMGPDDHVITAYCDHGHALRLEWIWMNVWQNYMGKKQDAPKVRVDPCIFLLLTKTFGVVMVLSVDKHLLGLAWHLPLSIRVSRGLVYVTWVMVPPTKAISMSHLILLLFGTCRLFTLLKIMVILWEPRSRAFCWRAISKRGDAFDIDFSVSEGHDIYEVRHNIGKP